jgi:hypothetical protein
MSELGTVTRVSVEDDSDVVRVDVSVTPTREHEQIPFRMPATGMWIIPEVGDKVEVTNVGDRDYVAHSPNLSPREPLPDDASGGDIIIRLNADTRLALRKQGDGSYNVAVECDGELSLDGQSVTIGENGKPVLTEDAVFEYTDADGNVNQTTTVVNGEITDTVIE